ncbi:MAG: divergent polysaccharide deacetylase family protein, partial [Pseudomonadota bacterium]
SSGRSKSGAFWLGAGVGAAFSVSLALALSLIAPFEERPAANEPEADLVAPIEDGESGEAPAASQTAAPSDLGAPPEGADEDVARPEEVPTPDAVAAVDQAEGDSAAVPTGSGDGAAPSAAEGAGGEEPTPGQAAPTGDEPEAVVVGAEPDAPTAAEAPDEEAETAAADDPAETPASEEVEVALAAPEDPAPAPRAVSPNALPPYKAYAEAYEGDASQPLLSIVLTGVGDDPAVLDELLLLPGPLTVVVSPTAEGLENLVLDLRDSGFEVLVGLDAEAAPSAIDAIGEAMGVASLGADFEEAAAESLVSAVESRGMALLDVTAPGGGAGYLLAKTRDLPAAPSGRRFDEIQTSAMVFQSLERAAFDANRDGVFIVAGEANRDVVTGLRRWMNVKANKSVAVAPLSVAIDKYVKQ